jgi:homospermidine synthase
MIGCGAIGGGLLPLIFRHIKVSPDRILVLSANEAEKARCEAVGVKWKHMVLTESNYEGLLTPLLHKDDLCLNMSSCVSSLAIIKLCQDHQVLYIDSSNETWDDSPDVLHLTWGRYVAKEKALKKTPGTPTALIS